MNYSNGNPRMHYTYDNNKIIKIFYYYENGELEQICSYSRDNKDHKVTDFYSNGHIKKESFYKNNELHNEKAPAVINYDINSNVISREFYLNGKKVDELAILINNIEE